MNESGPPQSDPTTPEAEAAPGAARRQAAILRLVRRARELLPGDSRFGDPLSTSGTETPNVLGRQVTELTAKRPSVLREVGLSALQVWQALAEERAGNPVAQELGIAFTDLAGFSSWALEAGDDHAVELLRDVAEAIEPPVKKAGGKVVKRLGDGMMAVFADPQVGLEAILAAREGLGGVEAPGYEPRMRAGIHVGEPREIGGDYFGVDVNVAARVAEEASAGELLVSDRALDRLDTGSFRVRRKLLFHAKGVPKDVAVYSLTPK